MFNHMTEIVGLLVVLPIVVGLVSGEIIYRYLME